MCVTDPSTLEELTSGSFCHRHTCADVTEKSRLLSFWETLCLEFTAFLYICGPSRGILNLSSVLALLLAFCNYHQKENTCEHGDTFHNRKIT